MPARGARCRDDREGIPVTTEGIRATAATGGSLTYRRSIFAGLGRTIGFSGGLACGWFAGLWLTTDDAPSILEEEHEVHRVTWKRREIVTLVKGFGRFVLGMHKQRAHADALGRSQHTDNRVLK